MKITLCIDKQQRGNPSEELKQYSIDIGCPLRSLDEVFDELKINTNDNNSLEGKIIRRCYVDKYGVLKKLDTEEVQTLDIPTIELFEGTNYVYILEYTNLNMKIEYLTNAEMNKFFATKMEMNSTIQQTYDSIMLKVSEKADSTEVSSMIKILANEIALRVVKGKVVNELNISDEIISIIGNRLEIDTENFKLTQTGKCTANNFSSNSVDITGGRIELYTDSEEQAPVFIIRKNENDNEQDGSYVSDTGFQTVMGNSSADVQSGRIMIVNWDDNSSTEIFSFGIYTPSLTQTSKLESKKNIEIFKNGLDVIRNTDIYQYHLKSQTDDDKKHIGFIIGENYNYSELITSSNNDGVDLYSMIAVAYQSIKEIVEKYDSKIEKQEARIKELKNEIEVLKNELRKN